MDVQVVVAALFDALQPRQLGQHHARHFERVHQRQPVERPVGDHDSLDLGKHTLRGDPRKRRRLCPGGHRRVGLDLEFELARQPCQPQRPQRIGRERLRRHHPQPARTQVAEAVERIDVIASAKRLGDCVDGEVALSQILLDGLPGERQQVQLPAAVPRDYPPGPEALRQLERVGVGGARELAGELSRIDGHRDVIVAGGPAEQPVAHGAANEPPAVGQLGQLAERRAHAGSAHEGSPSRW